MDLTSNDALSLVKTVQDAHRLLAGYYQRLLMALDSLATRCGANFWHWNPIDFDRPCISYTSPTSKWAWDFLPLLNANFVYTRTDDQQQVAIQFRVLADPLLVKANRHGNVQPDPTRLEASTPLLKVYVYGLKSGAQKSIRELWDDTPYPDGAALEVCSLSDDMWGTWWEIELSEFIRSMQGTLHNLEMFITPPVIRDGLGA